MTQDVRRVKRSEPVGKDVILTLLSVKLDIMKKIFSIFLSIPYDNIDAFILKK